MKVMINILLGRRLRKIRKILGVSSEDMAEALEVSVGHFQKLERGDHAFSLERLKVLREHYGIDLNYLVTGRSKEEDIARDLIYGTPEETFYFMHQLLDSCERMYLRRISEEGELCSKASSEIPQMSLCVYREKSISLISGTSFMWNTAVGRSLCIP